MPADARIGYEAMARQTIEEIERRLDDPPGFRELAARAHVSPYHFHRIFHAMVGESPRELVRRLRLERAAHRLGRTAERIVEIAFEAGYETHEAFTKSFQSEFGVAPSAFRAAARGCFGIRSRCSVHFVNGAFTPFHPVDRGGPPVRVEVVEMPAQRVAGVRHVGPYWQIGKAFSELAPRAAQLGLMARPGAMTVAAFLDDQETVPEAELRSIAGVLVAENAAIGDLEETWLPEGRFLHGEYTGHPSGLPDAWGTMYRQHVAAGDHRPREGVCFEVYVTGHDVAPDQMRTDLYLPIAD
jgi:AraC family transcriptional regulator